MKFKLKALFEYRDGALYWRTSPRANVKTGQRAGSFTRKGYREIMIDQKTYKEHRLIWIYFNGDIPGGLQIDHINHQKSDNRIENLRLVTHGQNRCHAKPNKNTRSGYKGVSYSNMHKAWVSRIQYDKKRRFLGLFKDARDAAKAYNEAALKLHGPYAKLNEI